MAADDEKEAVVVAAGAGKEGDGEDDEVNAPAAPPESLFDRTYPELKGRKYLDGYPLVTDRSVNPGKSLARYQTVKGVIYGVLCLGWLGVTTMGAPCKNMVVSLAYVFAGTICGFASVLECSGGSFTRGYSNMYLPETINTFGCCQKCTILVQKLLPTLSIWLHVMLGATLLYNIAAFAMGIGTCAASAAAGLACTAVTSMWWCCTCFVGSHFRRSLFMGPEMYFPPVDGEGNSVCCMDPQRFGP